MPDYSTLHDTAGFRTLFAEESEWDTAPGGAYDELPVNSEGLAPNVAHNTSGDMRNDGQIPSLKLRSKSSGGALDGQLEYSTYDKLLQAALRSGDWTNIDGTTGGTPPTDTDDITVVASTKTFTYAGGRPSGITAGRMIRTAGFSNAGNNGFHLVTAVGANTVTVDTTGLADESGTDVVTECSSIINGQVIRSFAIEKEFTDGAAALKYMLLTGNVVNTMRIGLAAEEMIGINFGLMGGSVALSSDHGSINSYTPVEKIDAVNCNGQIREHNATNDPIVTDLTLNVANNMRLRPQACSPVPAGVGKGQINVNGTVTMYFADWDIYTRFLADLASTLTYTFGDGNSGGYSVVLPQLKYTGGRVLGGGQGQDVVAAFDFTAYMHATFGFTIGLQRWVNS